MSTIKITCPYCGLNKNVDREKIPTGAGKIKCPNCKQQFPLLLKEETFDFEMAEEQPFAPETIPVPTAPTQGVDFDPSSQFKFCSSCGNQVRVNAEICPGCGVRVAPASNGISKVSLLLITFFLGGLGGHKFYQKKYLAGTLYLLFFWTYIPSIAAFVEFIIYACKSEAELQKSYPESGGGGAVVFIIAIPIIIAIIGILAAIAIPQFASYRERAFSAAANSDLKNCKMQAEVYYADYQAYPTEPSQLQCQASENVALYYIALNPLENRFVSFHKNGQAAFLSSSDESSISEDTREALEQELTELYGPEVLGASFHFIE